MFDKLIILSGLGIGAIVCIVVAAVIVLLILIVLAWWIATMNWFRKNEVKVKEASSGIDVALTKRYDLLTKSLATVKGYTKHESETLEKIISLRKTNANDLTIEEKNKLNEELDTLERNLNVVVENYPDLKADSQFLTLQNQISEAEDQLQASRRIYNSNVSIFNQKRVSFPSSIVANAIGYKKDLEFFAASENKKEDVEITF